jgi:hypothetical protein
MFFARYTSQADYVTNEPTMIMTTTKKPIVYESKMIMWECCWLWPDYDW